MTSSIQNAMTGNSNTQPAPSGTDPEQSQGGTAQLSNEPPQSTQGVPSAENQNAPAQQNADAAAKQNEEVAQKIAESAGLSMDTLSAAWREKGELPPEAYEKFSGMGLAREVIDSVCRSVDEAEQQRLASFKDSMAEAVGGSESLERLVAFVRSPTFDSTKRDELMSMITLDNPTQSKLALQEMQRKYEAEYGTSGNMINGQSSTGAGTGDVFASRQEQSKAIIEAERSGDPAKIRAAADKAARTSAHNRKNNITFK